MEVKAKAKFIRMSPKKIRLVIDMVRGKDVLPALDILRFTNKLAARPVIKLLDSAIANAEHNFKLERANLYIKEIRADEGPTLKRWMPRAFGRATTLRKRMTHLSIILDDKADRGKKPAEAVKKEEPPKETKAPEAKKRSLLKKDKKEKNNK